MGRYTVRMPLTALVQRLNTRLNDIENKTADFQIFTP